jgi:hypothetical protein
MPTVTHEAAGRNHVVDGVDAKVGALSGTRPVRRRALQRRQRPQALDERRGSRPDWAPTCSKVPGLDRLDLLRAARTVAPAATGTWVTTHGA